MIAGKRSAGGGKKNEAGFFRQVYDLVAKIPPGKVMTYGQIGVCLGGFYSGRTVGFAMRAAPAERNLPCHRVVNKQGEMAPGLIFGGADNQRRTLADEGVTFLPDGRIDMAVSRMENIYPRKRAASAAKSGKKRAK